jgi:hypothetical protein
MFHTRAYTLALIAGLYGCGGGGGGGSIPIEELGPELREAFCARLVRCGLVDTEASCAELVDLNDEEVQAGVAAGTVAYDGEAARECLDAFASASCDASAESARVDPPACAEAVRGTVADGGGCEANVECISGDCMTTSCQMACCPGTCATTVADAAVGSSCAAAPCVEGAYCDATMTCRTLIGVDQACNGNFECGYGLYCEQTSGPGVCRDAPNRGDSCPVGLCADLGDRCDEGTMTCVALSAAGGPCTDLFSCQAQLVCGSATTTCIEPPAVGQPCPDGACESAGWCDANMMCLADKPDGQMCTGSGECASDFCNIFATPSVCAAEPICISG